MPKSAAKSGSARHDLAELRQDLRAAERLVEAARAPIARLEAEIAAGEVAQARLMVLGRRHADRMAEWARTGQGPAPDPSSPERDDDIAALNGAVARADAARTVLPEARRRLEAAEHDLAVLRAGIKPVVAAILRQDGAALIAEYWSHYAALERLRRDLAALDQLMAADFPTIHPPTGRRILEHLSPEKLPAPETMRARNAACAGIPEAADFLATWRQVAATLEG